MKRSKQHIYGMLPFRLEATKIKSYIIWACICIQQNYLFKNLGNKHKFCDSGYLGKEEVQRMTKQRVVVNAHC
jgi:hypothetical protein